MQVLDVVSFLGEVGDVVMTLCQVWSWGRRRRDVHNDFIMTIEKEGIYKKDGDVMVEMVM